LGNDFELFKTYYNINSFGKWEGEHYVLIRNKPDAEIMEEFDISEETLHQKKDSWRSKLLNYRNKRAKPRLDDKTQTSWNALMLKGYVDAYKTFGTKKYLDAAIKNATFIAEQQIQNDGALLHIYKDGKSSINGYLEDYAAVIDAYIALYEATLNDKWIHLAKELTEYTYSHFFDPESSMFYFTSDEDEALVARNFEYRDNVIPASNSIMAKNLYILGHHFDEPKYGETSTQMLKNVLPEIEQYPSGFSNWLDLLANHQNKFYEVVVVGEDAHEKVAEINKNYLPNILVAGDTKKSDAYLLQERYFEGETFIYVCVNNACRLPVTETEKALTFIK
ncbi:MAG: thioredoxin domain-containing protein, partial [Flavobacteriaceae bacterium]|nr:thioredoxin domain-containing protein [Flavobacteriaceae bacterium]